MFRNARRHILKIVYGFFSKHQETIGYQYHFIDRLDIRSAPERKLKFNFADFDDRTYLLATDHTLYKTRSSGPILLILN